MLRHIVLFKIKPEYKAEIPQLVQNFYSMRGKIEGMVSIEAGADVPGIERIQTHADEFLEGLGYRHSLDTNTYTCLAHNEKRIALFAHAGFGVAFLSCVLDIPYPMLASHCDMQHSGVSVIRFNENEGVCVPRLLQLSNDSHLYREGLPTAYNNRVRI